LRIELERASSLKGEISPPPDKSISHRAIIISSIAEGKSLVRNFLRAGDTLSTVNAMRALGVEIEDQGAEMVVSGSGLRGLTDPADVIDCGNSGTTMRLLSGVLAGNLFLSVLTGDESLRRRPMLRVIKPLTQMGAEIMARDSDRLPPIAIRGGGLSGIVFKMPVASAQVKSAILLAGLYAEGTTEVIEPFKSRDHTERMLPMYGVNVEVDGLSIKIRGGSEPWAADVEVPGDFSSGAFFIGAALLAEGSEVKVKSVGLNPLRTGLLEVLGLMGAGITVENRRNVSGETVGDIIARTSRLKGVEVSRDLIPSVIDEFPLLCVVASVAEGVTTIRGAEELRVKESDRVKAMADGLKAMGVEVEEYPDGLSIKGTEGLRGAEVSSMGDHRIAMAFSVAALAASGKTTIVGAEAADISFPGFYDVLKGLSA
jgi:3-phosphoshikimate 1-carboxyvinyltransferase